MRWRSATIGSSTPISCAISFCIGSRGEHEMRRFERLAFAVAARPATDANASAAGVDADDLAAHELHAALAGGFEHHHAELLRAQPAGAPRVRDRHGLGR